VLEALNCENVTGKTGVTLPLAELAAETPPADVAVTVNVYAVPDVNPFTVIGLVDPVPVIPPGDDVAVYPVIGNLLYAGAVNATVTLLPVPKSVTVPTVGTPGAPFVAPALLPRIGTLSPRLVNLILCGDSFTFHRQELFR